MTTGVVYTTGNGAGGTTPADIAKCNEWQTKIKATVDETSAKKKALMLEMKTLRETQMNAMKALMKTKKDENDAAMKVKTDAMKALDDEKETKLAALHTEYGESCKFHGKIGNANRESEYGPQRINMGHINWGKPKQMWE